MDEERGILTVPREVKGAAAGGELRNLLRAVPGVANHGEQCEEDRCGWVSSVHGHRRSPVEATAGYPARAS
jgi:hypothetical protein